MKDLILDFVRKEKTVSIEKLLHHMKLNGFNDAYEIKSEVWHLTADGKLDFSMDWKIIEGSGYALY